ncbi:hypothetical protein SAMN04488096_10144 [Mesonia phycicola]|uniref:Outer membrane lipoprotein-sorting protein n=1 Tax=Mesonia phycicola TaxID=579105 RepID=A0A1M6A384_9FLAO|nr:DUF6503 family protein [Mesonia phycicola]SHI30917.1 hypothetical protein SAMN04488096_10144 [Mesonia phycicola]
MKIKLSLLAISIFTLISCKEEKQNKTEETQVSETVTPEEKKLEFENKAHELVYNMTQKIGDYNKLLDKKDVVFTYTYQTPDNKTNVSTEKYMFDGELSYGHYTQHERTMPNLEGEIEQGYDGKEYWLKHNGEIVTDTLALKKVAFNRPTNYYWFTMMQKLMDPSVNYEYVKEQTIDSTAYDVVKISFDAEDKKPRDIYQVYINKDTKLVDQFLFTVADYNKMTPSLMQLEYTEVDVFLIPSKRRYKASNWDAEVTDKPWVTANWTDIKFDNNLTKADFQK